MRFSSSTEFRDWPAKAVTVFGMSGVGKTTLGTALRSFEWFLYSVDYRIGTRYMDEHIVDNFKREAMRVPFLRDLLRSDSIYISSNITFENLSPLSTYLGKPGNPDKGGIAFAEYRRRLEQHRMAEIAALLDVEKFIDKARDIYDYQHFICDCGGSLCEVVNLTDRTDPVLQTLSQNSAILYIRGTEALAGELIERFKNSPKPMYYQPQFLDAKWAEFKNINGISSDDDVDPDSFAVWGFEQLIHHRIPLYEKIARRHGYTVEMADVPSVRDEKDFIDLMSKAIDTAAD